MAQEAVIGQDAPKQQVRGSDAVEQSDSGPKKAKERNPLLQVIDFSGSHKPLTIIGCILSGINAVVSIMPLVCIWFVVDNLIAVAPNWSEASVAISWGWWAVAFAIASVLIYFGALMCTHLAAFRTAANMRNAALEHLAKVPLGFFDTHPTGELRRVIDGCAGQTEGMLAHKLPDFVGALVTPLAFLVVMFVFDPIMGAVCLIPIVVSFVCLFIMMGGGGNKDYGEFMMKYQNALDKMNKAAVEYVRGIPVVKIFQQTVHSFRAFKEAIDEYSKMAHGYSTTCMKPQVLQLVAVNGTFAVLIPAGIIIASVTGDFASFLTNFLFYVIFSAITTMMMTKIMYASEAITMSQDSIRRINRILSVPLMQEVEPSQAEIPHDDSIEFRSVSFSYEGAQKKAIDGLSLKVASGSTVALVGPSGGGKTTTASLAPRFWDVDEGQVLIGGADVRKIENDVLMNKVAFVFQNEHLFKDSLLENIRAAKPGASREEVETAAKTAQCDDIIAKMPQGLDTVVGRAGTYLSGGEGQRIALARAILKDAPIVVLDEATAFADPENEALIQQALEKLCEGKTVLMIAHRLSTVAHADNICVLADGALVEQGTHEELVAAEGTYARMWADYRTSVAWKIQSASASMSERGDDHVA
ncbi:MAG: ABC transporter ATP-binding protein [Raoultibacter sp.]|jgi:ATP-binding cassette subfamily B protein IrtA